MDGKEWRIAGDDVINGVVTIDGDRLYKLIKLPAIGTHMLKLEFLDGNAELTLTLVLLTDQIFSDILNI